MKKTLVMKLIGALFLIQIHVVFALNPIEDKVDITRYFGKIAISSVTSQDQNREFAGYKLLVRPVIYNEGILDNLSKRYIF